jgi:small subunit ribosomal protein S1
MDQQDAVHATGEENTNNKEITNMASLLEKEGLGLELPQAGEIKTGTIASIAPGQIMVSIGAKSEGIISGQEFELIPPDIFASMEVGQEIPVFVITPEDHNGNLILSYIRALEAESWEKASAIMKEKESFTGKVVGYNRGGLLVSFEKLRGFVPTSQLSFSRRTELSGENAEKKFGEMIGEEIALQIIEVDQERRRLIFSERAASHETRDSIRDKVIEKLEVGDVRTGRVTSLADFGAFVNINGADGLVHLSEISWDRIRHPGDELKVGQEVQVQVISIDEDKRHIGLSIRRLKDDPWQSQIKGLRVGQLVEAKITRLTKFGAFAMLDSGIEGLVHISEISEEHITHPKEVLHEDDQVTLRIIKIEPDSHRIGLSLRRVESLAFADMDLKALEKELENTDIKVVPSEKAESKKKPKSKAKEPEEKPEAVLDELTEAAPEEKIETAPEEITEAVPEEKTDVLEDKAEVAAGAAESEPDKTEDAANAAEPEPDKSEDSADAAESEPDKSE